MSLKFDDFLHPKARGRISLDYPLDVLLNRSCLLGDYEDGAIEKLHAYNTELYRWFSKDPEAHAFSREDFDELSGETLNSLKNDVTPEKRKSHREAVIKRLKKRSKRYKNIPNDLLHSFFEIYQCCNGELGGIRLPKEPDNLEEESIRPDSQIGSGNILIKGRPGTGKSTLALQMAVACTWRPNHYSSVFFSLEESSDNVMAKAVNMGWDKKCCPVRYLDDIDDTSSPEQLGKALKNLLTQPDDCPMKSGKKCKTHPPHKETIDPCVIMPMLSPRSISPNERGADSLFWERYKQLEKILIGAHWLRTASEEKNNGIPDIRMVCIDSLNVFGDQLLTRTELFKLFDLFNRFGVIGIFTTEQDLHGEESVSTDSANYLADIVINLKMEEDNGYSLRYFEIEKSRYQHEVYGKHPLRMRGPEIYKLHRSQWSNSDKTVKEIYGLFAGSNLQPDAIKNYLNMLEIKKDEAPSTKTHINPDNDLIESYTMYLSEYYWYLSAQGTDKHEKEEHSKQTIREILENRGHMHQPIMVQPSVHYIVSATERNLPEIDPVNMSKAASRHTPAEIDAKNTFDLGEENLNEIIKPNLPRGSTVTILGQRGTYKTIMARNFLLHGVCTKKESVLLINFGEKATFPFNEEAARWRTSRPDKKVKEVKWERFSLIKARGINDSKRCLDIYEYDDQGNDDGYGKGKNPVFIELSLKGGALIPEELLEFVRDILRQYSIDDTENRRIRRVVLDDCALIGVSYPFLMKSRTAGDLFLSAFVHIIKKYGIDLVITGTTRQLKESDEMVERASELADSVITCDYCDVFGDRYVTVSGEGLTAASMYRNQSTRYFEYAPAVIMADKGTLEEEVNKRYFKADLDFLKGLVGFGTGKVHRPGLTIHLFTQPGDIYGDYKKEVEGLMLDAVESSMKTQLATTDEKPDIQVKAFEVTGSDAYHSSLEVLKGKPIDRTVVYNLDEFWKSADRDINESLADLSEYFPFAKTDKNESPDCRWSKRDFAIWPCAPKRKDNNKQEHSDKAVYAVPFYANVLVIAYHKDKISLPQYTPGKDYKVGWSDIAEAVEKNNALFYCDQGAKETLSCLLLDCLVAANKSNLENNLNVPDRKDIVNQSFQYSTFEKEVRSTPDNPIIQLDENDITMGSEILDLLNTITPTIDRSFLTNLKSIRKLFRRQLLLSNTEEKSKREKRIKADILDKSAALHVCWYSQLRQLIKNNPELADKIKICPLPGGGFRGDWYLAIAKGSVSMDLGVNAVEILTKKHEEYNRFAKGVGLPVRHEFMKEENGFLAWPHASDVKALDIFTIHRYAFSRASIPGYTRFRRMLSTMMEEVNWVEGTNETEINKNIEKIVTRIPEQIKLLNDTTEENVP
ncbi:MAG: hypothetical protein JXA71_19220 [Chitinispirillaceae bacterium]|nr:hypothetical protein [Chitinispirillaceae bacterium]